MIIGHQKQWKFLENAFKSSRYAHAYLFSGPEGVGKMYFAMKLSKDVLKLRDNAGKDIAHPDFIIIERLPDNKEILISQITDMIYELSLKPFASDCKIAIINGAHLMNLRSQNCLLKTLEEPKGNAVIFLITSQPQALLETIRSRVQEIRFNPLSNDLIKSFLLRNGANKNEAEKIADLSLGMPRKALDFFKNPENLK